MIMSIESEICRGLKLGQKSEKIWRHKK